MDAPVDGASSGVARRPVVWMMEPSFRARMRVDCTPGREVRCDRRASTWGGIWGFWEIDTWLVCCLCGYSTVREGERKGTGTDDVCVIVIEDGR